MKIRVFTIFLMFCFSYEAVLADDNFPTTGIVYGVMENRSLTFDCKESGRDLIACNFTIAGISKKLTEDKANAKILEEMKEYESRMEEFSKENEGCSQAKLIVNVIEGKAEPPDPVVWKKSMSTKNQREIDDVKSNMESLINLCNKPTKNNYRKFISTQIIKDSKTCNLHSQNYQQTFKRVQDFDEKTEIWAVVSEPYGVCGLVQLDRFEREESSTEGLFFWNYYAKKFVTNKKGQTLLGTKCTDLDENEYEYNWRSPDPKYMGCEYIEYSIF